MKNVVLLFQNNPHLSLTLLFALLALYHMACVTWTFPEVLPISQYPCEAIDQLHCAHSYIEDIYSKPLYIPDIFTVRL